MNQCEHELIKTRTASQITKENPAPHPALIIISLEIFLYRSYPPSCTSSVHMLQHKCGKFYQCCFIRSGEDCRRTGWFLYNPLKRLLLAGGIITVRLCLLLFMSQQWYKCINVMSQKPHIVRGRKDDSFHWQTQARWKPWFIFQLSLTNTGTRKTLVHIPSFVPTIRMI